MTMTPEQIAHRMAALAFEKVYDRVIKSFEERTIIPGDSLNLTYKLDIKLHVKLTEDGFLPVEKES